MAQVSFRMDDDLKMSAEETFRSMGMTMSTAINIFRRSNRQERSVSLRYQGGSVLFRIKHVCFAPSCKGYECRTKCRGT